MIQQRCAAMIVLVCYECLNLDCICLRVTEMGFIIMPRLPSPDITVHHHVCCSNDCYCSLLVMFRC